MLAGSYPLSFDPRELPPRDGDVGRGSGRTREAPFNDRFYSFCRHWGVTPRACAPYRARANGREERNVGYVKKSVINSHRFDSDERCRAHLERWLREAVDVRVHETTGEPPITRFAQEALRPLPGKGSFLQVRELTRRV